MSAIRSPLSDGARSVTGEALQGTLIDLIDLSLSAKQLHWNVTGRTFRSVHRQLDEVVDLARRYADATAERAVAIGVNPDGQSSTVARSTHLPGVEVGYIPDEKVIRQTTEVLAGVVTRMRTRMDATEKADPVTQNLIIEIVHDLEEQHWMFQAMV
ncbi:DNA starvation/stationary phase protection protein [Frankia sp. CcI156]|uniref:Ferritin and Dps n=1 Tax=Frankia casuarinae (strain DSM 45818 / CECT 9043 / HFP020203 / CcI3) TaxID=106370 RepID=Q2J754_FRACC|nr:MULTISPECIES: DNA starvation/stationary phase protection protein [Frankia]ABD12888.1 Ferritin and Dps [Frankia casuarinae]ETA03487.1 DNA-binding ferritin-like protein (oxidative damage protectant) [Frankia sp. CcI6]EYT89938.1 DNA-binding ferritin-like protein (oxidative damage protectant) [Frankia casuarinae]KDA43674.1 DNA-binding ferritin-like protein (oxidative damage protectant) [Frankia sp. BMG5.23]KEZ35639.1 DNA-binding ferritin-like protein (oxidative damage protectant) [Frankia sp. C